MAGGDKSSNRLHAKAERQGTHTSDEGTLSSGTPLPLGDRINTTRRLRSSPLQRFERDHLAHTQLQRIGHRLQALN